MASKRTGRKFLSDNVVNARRAAAQAKAPARGPTIISGGMKYKPGHPPVRVCPAGGVRGAVRRAVSNSMLRKI